MAAAAIFAAVVYPLRATEVDLFSVLDRLTQAPRLDHGDVQRIVGVRLTQVPNENSLFDKYSGDGATFTDAVIGLVTFVEPKIELGAMAGPALLVKIRGGCITRPAVEKHYGRLKISVIQTVPEPPRGRATIPEPANVASYFKTGAWGQLDFLFDNGGSGCLQRVDLDRPLSAARQNFRTR